MGQPDDKPGFIEEALRHRQVTSADGGPIDEAAGDPTPEPVPSAPEEVTGEPEVIAEPEPAPADAGFTHWPVAERALIDEAMKKAGLIWLHGTPAPDGQAYWHVWLDGGIYLLTGGPEQPDGGLVRGAEVRVVVASKDNHARLLSFRAQASELRPTDPDWTAATTALAGSRLNLPDAPGAPDRWARDASVTIFRLTPSSPEGERPGTYSGDSRRAAPRPTPATTMGAKPRVLHRRHGSGRPLS